MQVCETNWIRSIVRGKEVDKTRIDERKREIGVKGSYTKKLVRSRLKWAGHVERTCDEKLTKKSDAQ